ncbi:hypothetical protein [Prevotella sp. oral taxon 376]|uniref:hypothetical protein n=1 Tax=Prevotella sp. oral taxon 376 TaxID=712466 RepID=UPI0011B239BF|nr:hypothetical protein [Prevotella sp. oral taxon 376]
MKEIYSYISDGSSLFSREKLTDRARGFMYLCECPERCNLYAQGMCLLRNYVRRCKYGKINSCTGPTMRAKSYGTFIRDFKAEHKETLNVSLGCVSKVCNIVDLVYLPIPFLHNNKDADFALREDFGFGGTIVMVEKSKFTKEFIDKHILQFRPRTWFDNAVIEDYLKKHLPAFMNQLKDYNLHLFREVIAMRPEYNELYSNVSNVGRKADLRTLTPNKGTFVDCHGAHWSWDGKYLVSEDTNCAFMPIDASQFSRIKVMVRLDKPVPIKITDDEQVNEQTVFFD